MPAHILELRSVFGTGGGPEKTILQGAALSDAARYRVTVCYIRDRRDRSFAIDRRAAGLPIDYVEVIEESSYDLSIFGALRGLVRNRGIDIVHAHDYKTNFYALLLKWFEGVTALTTLHGYTGDSWKERIYYAVDRRMVRAFPRIIAVSHELAGEAVAAGTGLEQVVTIPNGIDHRVFRRVPEQAHAVRDALGIAPGEVVVGSVGRLERQKRFDLLMQAFAGLQTAHPDVRLKLLIAGDGSLRQQLVAEQERLGLSAACVFAGQITDVAEFHHALDVFVQSSDYEGTPNAVLEAMAMETPIVATAAGGTADLVRDGIDGLVTPLGDVPRLIGAISEILSNPQGAAQRVASARRRVEGELSFERRMGKVERVYDVLLRHRTPSRSAFKEAGPL
jgi:glycosyltransferase involved in cell wall biosynthesis